MSEKQSPKSYGQLCPLALALDHIGDRWSLLLIRELLGGSARFGELEAALPGIPTNLLASRLRRLLAAGVVERADDGSAYAITELGSGLRPALEALGAWGLAISAASGSAAEPIQAARSAAMGLEAMIGHGVAPERELVVELAVEADDYLTIVFGGEAPATVRAGRPPTCDGRVRVPDLGRLSRLPFEGLGVVGFAPVGPEDVDVCNALLTVIESGIAALSAGA